MDSHMNSLIGKEVVPMVGEYNNSHTGGVFKCQCRPFDIVRYEARFFQLVTSPDLSRCGCVYFHSLPVILLNFTKLKRREQAMKRGTAFACLLIRYGPYSSDWDNAKYPYTVRHIRNFAHLDILVDIYYRIKYVMGPLSCPAVQHVHMTVADGYHIMLHLLLSFYLFDIPEARGLIGVMSGKKLIFIARKA